MTITNDIWAQHRPGKQHIIWHVRIHVHQLLMFDDTWLALNLSSEVAAGWLASHIEYALTHQHYTVPKGHKLPSHLSHLDTPSILIWQGQHDDTIAHHENYELHTEHLHGPLRGGLWWASIAHQSHTVWNSDNHPDLRLKNIYSAQWVAELILMNHIISSSSSS